jgi:hypothetical protein
MLVTSSVSAWMNVTPAPGRLLYDWFVGGGSAPEEVQVENNKKDALCTHCQVQRRKGKSERDTFGVWLVEEEKEEEERRGGHLVRRRPRIETAETHYLWFQQRCWLP